MDVLGNKHDDEDIDMLVCARTANSPRPVYGSIRATCLECKSPIWVSLSGQKAMKKAGNLKPYCMECAAVKMEESDEEIKASIVPGAIEELKKYLLNIENN